MKHCCDMLLLILIFLLSSFDKLHAEDDKNRCTAQENCNSCIRIPGCVWCAVPVDSKQIPSYRCEDSKLATDDWCTHMVNPENNHITKRNASLGNLEGNAIQISPQMVDLKLRVGIAQTLDFHYGSVGDYPLDLYYVMDLSYTMHEHKKELAKLGNELVDVMQNLTTKFQIGFGSFIDKVVLPFVNTEQLSEPGPCGKKKNIMCVPPYSFKNHMSLSTDTTLFFEKVAAANVSSGLDEPEGGFDALMQAMVCTKEIGWRENAHHLLVYSSDASYHIAGDGKLAGIVEPHDGHCHMKNGFYTHDTVFDYPSVGQLSEMASEKNMHIIFAVTEKREKLYEELSQHIPLSSHGILNTESKSVINLIREKYAKIVESVDITHNASEYIDVKFLSNCNGEGEKFTPGSSCEDLVFGENKSNITFRAIITVKKCPDNREDWTQFLEIRPGGINNSLIVTIDIMCECDCEDKKNVISKSHQACNYGGHLDCGICVCDSSHFGKRCECQNNVTFENHEDCQIDGLECSGAGKCRCGVCECNSGQNPGEIISGKYCECTNYNCKRGQNKELCSGGDHGKCICGSCQCLPGWTGEKCECSDRKEDCIPKGGGPICSDRGKCVCGKCVCDSTSYEGQYCEQCPICPADACNKLKKCVECEAYIQKDCEKCIFKHNLTLQESVTDDSFKNEENTSFCRFPDDNDCTFSFVYTKLEEEDAYKIIAEKEKRCSNVNVLAVVLGVIGSILLIGLLTLIIWKIVTSIHDQREYTKFEKERANAKFSRDDNPLYKNATFVYKNPTYSEEN